MKRNEVRILIVDDEKSIRDGLSKILKASGYHCFLADDGKSAYHILMTETIDIIISDINMPGMNGFELLEKINKLHISVPVIFITGHGSIEMAVEAIQKGAYEFFIKPINIKNMELLLEKIVAERGEQPQNKLPPLYERKNVELIGESPAIVSLVEKIRHIAPTKSNIYIYGESGTGKEVVCDLIHQYDDVKKPLVKVNCAALSPSLLESELFGHEKGSFTGATDRQIGRFEAANGGTLFLDEISEISKETQVKLLRVIQEKKIERVGSSTPISVDIRLICASNKDLKKQVALGEFREDLFYRLNVIDLYIPPLRERIGDVEIFARYFFEKYSQMNNKQLDIDDGVYKKLMLYHWPGNVRELQNAIEKIVVLSHTSRITAEFLPSDVNVDAQHDFIAIPYGMPMEQVKDLVLRENLRRYDNNKSKVAKILGLARKTIQRQTNEKNSDEKVTRTDKKPKKETPLKNTQKKKK